MGKSLKTVFLGISKVFDKVWHQGEILKLKQIGISGILLNMTEDFLANRYQRVVLNEQTSGWAGLNTGVSQGSNLVFLFLVYMTDLSIYIIKS